MWYGSPLSINLFATLKTQINLRFWGEIRTQILLVPVVFGKVILQVRFSSLYLFVQVQLDGECGKRQRNKDGRDAIMAQQSHDKINKETNTKA